MDRDVVLVGNGQGFWGDSMLGPVRLVREGPLHYLTLDYLAYLREKMGAAARAMEPFDEVYAKTDWSRFEGLPLFRAANRMNAYNTYLLMEREGD